MPEENGEYEAYNMSEETEVQPDQDEEIYEEDIYSSLSDSSSGNKFLEFIKKYGTLLAVAVAALAILIVLYQRLPKAPTEELRSSQIAALETRVEQLENEITRLIPLAEKSESAGDQGAQFEQLLNRVDRLEENTLKRMDEISAGLETQKKTAAPKAKPAPKKPAAVKKAPPPSARYHTVQPGDTIYGIGRKYDLPVPELLKLNGLPANTVIQPGQKLRLSR